MTEGLMPPSSIYPVIEDTTNNLTKREKPKEKTTKIDAGEKGWKRAIDKMIEKTKTKEEART